MWLHYTTRRNTLRGVAVLHFFEDAWFVLHFFKHWPPNLHTRAVRVIVFIRSLKSLMNTTPPQYTTIHTHIHTHIHTYTHMHTHAHIHIHTRFSHFKRIYNVQCSSIAKYIQSYFEICFLNFSKPSAMVLRLVFSRPIVFKSGNNHPTTNMWPSDFIARLQYLTKVHKTFSVTVHSQVRFAYTTHILPHMSIFCFTYRHIQTQTDTQAHTDTTQTHTDTHRHTVCVCVCLGVFECGCVWLYVAVCGCVWLYLCMCESV